MMESHDLCWILIILGKMKDEIKLTSVSPKERFVNVEREREKGEKPYSHSL